ncbi:MAG: hypothetical protein ACK5M3_12560 [Dysgonomonas sp.]
MTFNFALKKSTSYLVLFTSILFLSCSSKDEEESSEDIIQFDDIISVDVKQELSKHMPIYTGNNPPNVEGNYYFDPLLIYSTVKEEEEDAYEENYFSSEILLFTNQTKLNTIDFLEWYIDEDDDEEPIYETPGSGYIFGEGDKFTTCTIINESKTSGSVTATGKLAMIISGQKTSAGISNLYATVIVLEKDDPNGLLDLFGVNEYRMAIDKDKLANNFVRKAKSTNPREINNKSRKLLLKRE